MEKCPMTIFGSFSGVLSTISDFATGAGQPSGCYKMMTGGNKGDGSLWHSFEERPLKDLLIPSLFQSTHSLLYSILTRHLDLLI